MNKHDVFFKFLAYVVETFIRLFKGEGVIPIEVVVVVCLVDTLYKKSLTLITGLKKIRPPFFCNKSVTHP